MSSTQQIVGEAAKCPLCCSTETSYFDHHSRADQKLFRCHDCKFYFAYPHEPIIHGVMEGIADEDAGEGYWANSEAMRDYIDWREGENSRLADWVIQTGDLGKLLEVGVGDGPLMKRLAPHCTEYFGLEPDPEAFGRLKDRFPEFSGNVYPFLSSDLDTKEPFSSADGTFDTICMMSVLEHISAPRDFLKSSHRLLKNGGKLLISVPNSRSFRLFYRLRKIMNIEPWTYFHISFFRKRSLVEVLESEQFRITDVRTHTLLTPDSISYFKKRFHSPMLGLGMRFYKALGLDAASGMNTIFIIAEKAE